MFAKKLLISGLSALLRRVGLRNARLRACVPNELKLHLPGMHFHAPSKLNIVPHFAIIGFDNTEPALDQAFGLLVSVS